MSEKRFNNQLLRQSRVIIPQKYLNPEMASLLFQTKATRSARIATPIIATGVSMIQGIRPVAIAAGSSLSVLMMNPYWASRVREAYGKIDFSKPLFLPEYESKYPEGWISAARIKQTHPIFFIDLKGNLTFIKSSRMEYYRYLYQKSFPGKMGYHTWWLRGYIETPKVPESVKKWAKQKLHAQLERIKELKPLPNPKPTLVPARARLSKAKPPLLRRRK